MRYFSSVALFITSLSISVSASSSLFTIADSASYTPIGCLSFLFPTPYHTARQLSSYEKCISHCISREGHHEIIAWEPLAKGVLCTCGTDELFGSSGDTWDECDESNWRVLLNDRVSLGFGSGRAMNGGDEKRGEEVIPFVDARSKAKEKHIV